MKKTAAICLLLFSAAIYGFGSEITIDDYIRLVEKNSKQLLQAAKDIEIADATEKTVRSQAYPMIGAEIGYTRNLSDIEQSWPVAADTASGMLIYQDIDVNTDNEFSFGLSLSQQIFNMKVFNAIKASREFKLMSGYIYDIQNQTVITLAKKVYYQNFLLEKLLEVKKEVENNSHENYLNVRKKFENGLVSQFELLRTEVDWKMKIPETTQARKNLDLAKINLKNLAGIPLEDEVILKSDINDYPEMPQPVPLPDILKERPDYKSLVREMSLREINVKAAMSDHYPTVAGNILYGVSSGSDDFSLDGDKTTVTQVGIKVSLPIYSGGALSAQDKKAKSEFDQTEIKLKQLKENILSEINSIYLTLKETGERIESAAATMETAMQAYEIAQTSYNSGMATQLDLKDAALSLELAKISHISAVYEYLAATFDWDMAIGKAVMD